MSQGFPMEISTVKVSKGHYRIKREDGYSIEVRSSSRGGWYQVGNMARRDTLRSFQNDMQSGFMPRDQIG